MEQPIASHQVDFGLLAVEIFQQSWFRYLSADTQKIVDLLDSFESLLPEIHLDGVLQLLKTDVHQALNCLRLIKLQ